MKFVISFFLMFPAWAGPIRIFHENNPEEAQLIKDIFMRTYQIPEELMVMKELRKCEDLKLRGKLDLCLKNNGDLIVVSVDRGFVSESLKIFRAP